MRRVSRVCSLSSSALLARRACSPRPVSASLGWSAPCPAVHSLHSIYKKRPCARWIRVPGRGSLWLLPPGPDQVRNISSPEPIERARRLVYGTRFHRRRLGKHRLIPTDEKSRHARLCIFGINGAHCGKSEAAPCSPSRLRNHPPARCGKYGVTPPLALQILSYRQRSGPRRCRYGVMLGECGRFGVIGSVPLAQRSNSGVKGSQRCRSGVTGTCGGR